MLEVHFKCVVIYGKVFNISWCDRGPDKNSFKDN